MKVPTHQRKNAKLNITSMLDVTFLLLIFFVLTANFAVDEGALATEMPRGFDGIGDAPQMPEETLRIVITGSGPTMVARFQGAINATATTQDEVYRLLETSRFDPKTNPNGLMSPKTKIVIDPADATPWDDVVGVFNAAIRAKMTDVSFTPAG